MAIRATLDDQAILPLESGDRLTREEFERLYEASPDTNKAELIDGVVYVASPVSRHHSAPQSRMNSWLAVYADAHPGCEAYPNVTVRLLDDSEVQPDVLLKLVHGMAETTREGYFTGAPELVVEIATSSASVDMHAKRLLYERAASLSTSSGERGRTKSTGSCWRTAVTWPWRLTERASSKAGSSRA